MRPQFKGKSSAFGIPQPVVVGCLHAKGVAARLDVRVVCGAPRTGLGPAAVETLQHKAVAHLLWRGKAQSRVIKLEVYVSCLNAQRRACRMEWLGHIVHGKSLQLDRRRNGVHREVRRVNLHQAFGRGKPKAPIAGAPGRWVAVGGRLPASQPIGSAELDAWRSVTSCLIVATRNARPSGEPQVTVFIVEDRADAGMIHAGWENLPGAKVQRISHAPKKLFSIPQVPPAVLSTDQQGLITDRRCCLLARGESCNHIAREAIRGGVIDDLAAALA